MFVLYPASYSMVNINLFSGELVIPGIPENVLESIKTQGNENDKNLIVTL